MTAIATGGTGFLAAALLLTVLPASAGENEPDLEEGRRIFTEGGGDQPACAVCHTLADAEAAGTIGPNLDELKPEEDRVRLAVAEGVGVMPAFAEALAPEEIDAVARYVAEAAGN